MEFKRLFSPLKIKDMELRNRIVMLPISTGYDEADATIGERFIDFFAARAKGGAALIDMPFTPMSDGHTEPGLYDDRFFPGIRNLTSRIHEYGAKAAAQLLITYLIEFKGGRPEIVAPSPILNKVMRCIPRELTVDEIKKIIPAFGQAAVRAREGGFDAVEVPVVGGYLLNRFLSPISNQRNDEYGGNLLENRMRIILEIIESIKREAGQDFPVICRLNVEEQMPGGHTLDDSKEVILALVKSGVDVINTYTGWHESPVPTVAPSVPKGAFVYLARRIKEYVSLPVVAANRINDPFMAEKILAEAKADLIGMCRPLVADPEFPNKAKEGRADEITPCLACTECLAQVMTVGYGGDRDALPTGPLCSLNPLAGRENRPSGKSSRKKRVFIIGSGPGGMTASIEAANAGHEVTIVEQAGEPGGRLRTAAIPPFKGEIFNLIKSMYVRARKAGVTFQFNTRAVPEWIEKEKPDVLILATGADPLMLPIPGIDKINVLLAEDVLTGRQQVKGTVIVIGGGMVGCETAEFIKKQDVTDVIILEMLGRMADNVVPTYRPFFVARLKQEGIKMKTNTRVTEITDQGVKAIQEGVEAFIPGDTVVLAAGFKADPGKLDIFKGKAAEVCYIGDCIKARNIKDAVAEGFDAAHSF